MNERRSAGEARWPCSVTSPRPFALSGARCPVDPCQQHIGRLGGTELGRIAVAADGQQNDQALRMTIHDGRFAVLDVRTVGGR
jgi:hypothetical protein